MLGGYGVQCQRHQLKACSPDEARRNPGSIPSAIVVRAQGQSPLSGQALERVALRDVLLALRNRFGLRITMLEGNAADKLELEMGGMAGLLRH